MILKSKIDGEYVVSKKWRRAPLKDAQKAIFDGERARKNGEPILAWRIKKQIDIQ